MSDESAPTLADTSAARVDPTVIDAVPVALDAHLGVANITIGRLAALRSGETLELDTPLGGVVEVRLGDSTIAFGELVAVGDYFGVRITRVGG